MSLTDEVIYFLKINNNTDKFLELVGIKSDELEDWLYDTIMPNNIEIFFNNGIVFNYNNEKWGDEISTKWRQIIPSILKKRKKCHVDSLVGMSLNESLPPILRNIANQELSKIDEKTLEVNPIIASSFFKKLSKTKEIKIEEVKKDPNNVCANCTFCDLRREECSEDIWWSLNGIDITTKTCDKFIKKEFKIEERK